MTAAEANSEVVLFMTVMLFSILLLCFLNLLGRWKGLSVFLVSNLKGSF